MKRPRSNYALYLLMLLPVAAIGAGSVGTPAEPTPGTLAATPQERSQQAYQRGLKFRDKALQWDTRAARTTSASRREKFQKKATAAYNQAIQAQSLALKADAQNYRAANELGFALRKTGEHRKAIGAYNYALALNPEFYPAIEYRGEAYLRLNLFEETQQAYMTLFRNERDLADMLMQKFDDWVASTRPDPTPAEVAFIAWVTQRKQLAKATQDLSSNAAPSW